MKLKVTFLQDHPGDKFTDVQVNEWLSYKLGASPAISADNPLARTSLSATGKISIERQKPEKSTT